MTRDSHSVLSTNYSPFLRCAGYAPDSRDHFKETIVQEPWGVLYRSRRPDVRSLKNELKTIRECILLDPGFQNWIKDNRESHTSGPPGGVQKRFSRRFKKKTQKSEKWIPVNSGIPNLRGRKLFPSRRIFRNPHGQKLFHGDVMFKYDHFYLWVLCEFSVFFRDPRVPKNKEIERGPDAWYCGNLFFPIIIFSGPRKNYGENGKGFWRK